MCSTALSLMSRTVRDFADPLTGQFPRAGTAPLVPHDERCYAHATHRMRGSEEARVSAPTDDPAAVRPAPAALPESPENAPPATAGSCPLPDLPAATLSDLPPVPAHGTAPVPTVDPAP